MSASGLCAIHLQPPTHHLCFFLRHRVQTLLEYEPLEPAPVLLVLLLADWSRLSSEWAVEDPAASDGLIISGVGVGVDASGEWRLEVARGFEQRYEER